MKPIRLLAALLCLPVLSVWLPAAASAQVTTATLSGRVADDTDRPLPGIQIVVTNTSTGRTTGALTRQDGRYLLPGLPPGGPYRVEARGLGYAPVVREDVVLTLGQTSVLNFELATEAIAVEGIEVRASRNAQMASNRMGTATVVDDSTIARMPTITRDFTDFTRLTPQISTSGEQSNAAGRNHRFNTIQLDGAAYSDVFGLTSSGSPSGQASAKPITLEAIQEFQVVLSPMDVRLGGFTGAGINAVTKSGTNRLRGTLTFFNKNDALVGQYNALSGQPSGAYGDFYQNEVGFSLGGPLRKDKLHFFAAGEVVRRSAPIGNVAGQGDSEITVAEAQQVADILETKYGYRPGAIGAVDLARESNNLFGRLDWNINPAHRMTLRHNHVAATDDDLSRSNSLYRLGGSMHVKDNAVNSTVAQLNSTLRGDLFNELRVGYTTIRDKRIPQDNTPSVRVTLPRGAGGDRRIFAGSEQFSGKNALDQDVLELTNDLTFAAGRHRVTLGTRNEFFSFSNLFVRNAFGYYEFGSPADLDVGRASRYEYSYLLPGGAPRAEFSAYQWAVYLQNEFALTDHLTLSAGIRYDVTTMPDRPAQNDTVAKYYERNTSDVPSGNGLINPRVGFNWNVGGQSDLQLRGGIGLFSGRTPYVWLSNAYGNTGLEYVRFTCTGARTPAFVADPNQQPTSCAGATNLAPNEINTVDPEFRLPQVWRANFAVDKNLPFGLVGTLEGLYTETVHDVLPQELNLEPVGTTVEGRPRFGPRYTTAELPSIGSVFDVTNTEQGYSYALTGQLQRAFLDRWGLSAAYTYTQARDVNSTVSSQASSNWRTNPIDGDPNDPKLRPSNYEVPHRLLLTASYEARLLPRASTNLSLIYVGESGRPYSFVYSGDVNGDGWSENDLVYVPASASEIRFSGTTEEQAASWANLDEYIEGTACLRAARGTVLERNACREPWQNRVDLRLAQSLPTVRGQNVQVTMDILNFLNLLNEDWGKNRFVFNQRDRLLSTASTTPDAAGRVLFQPFGANKNQFSLGDLASRYQIQLGVKYSF